MFSFKNADTIKKKTLWKVMTNLNCFTSTFCSATWLKYNLFLNFLGSIQDNDFPENLAEWVPLSNRE